VSRKELFFSGISQFFSQEKTRWWVKFFLIAQLGAHALLIVALIVDGQYMQTHRRLEPWLEAWLIIYSPLNILLSLIQGPSYFSPLAFFPWAGPIVLIYPYSLILGGLTASIERLNPRAKRLGLVLMPFLLVFGFRMYQLSSPHYAFNSFLAAARSGDTVAARQFTTSRFAARNIVTPEDSIQVIWDKPDSTHADVTYKMNDGSYYRYFLLKTAEGWKVDEASFNQ